MHNVPLHTAARSLLRGASPRLHRPASTSRFTTHPACSCPTPATQSNIGSSHHPACSCSSSNQSISGSVPLPAVLGSCPENPSLDFHPAPLPAHRHGNQSPETGYCCTLARYDMTPQNRAPSPRLLLLFSCRESWKTSGGLLLKLNDVLPLSSCPRTTGCTFRASRNSPFSPAHAPTGGTMFELTRKIRTSSCPRAYGWHANEGQYFSLVACPLRIACNVPAIACPCTPMPSPPAVPCALS